MGWTKQQTQIIKAIVPVVQEHGVRITTEFYGNMLREHPELNAVFNNTHQTTGHQARALAGALYAYAANIDNLEALAVPVRLIVHKHVSLYMRLEQYDIVGEYLLAALKQVLVDATLQRFGRLGRRLLALSPYLD
ncbi:globin-like protein [Lipomyces kononenkoae]|uniref:Globin-like protein n=1 Tax=Lipomyces kononenkoae TaxID=34357 RepID=A0ACC3T5L5_LIPKO